MRIFALFAMLLFPLIVSSQEDSKRIDFSDVNHNSNASSIINNSSSNSIIDSLYSYNKDSVHRKTNNNNNDDGQHSFVNFATGYMGNKNGGGFYLSTDLGLNLGLMISDIVYLDAGSIFFNTPFGIGLIIHITPGFGFNVIKKKIFVFAGAGFYSELFVGTGYNINFRINYNLSKKVSIGLDNRYANYSEKLRNLHSDRKIETFSMGLNLSLGL